MREDVLSPKLDNFLGREWAGRPVRRSSRAHSQPNHRHRHTDSTIRRPSLGGTSPAIPHSIVLGHDRRRLVAPNTTPAMRSTSATRVGAIPRSGPGPSSSAVLIVAALGIRVVLRAVVEPAIDRLLALAWRAVFAEAPSLEAFHKPDSMLYKLHRRAEDGWSQIGTVGSGPQVWSAEQVCVHARVGRVRVYALLVDPEGIAIWEAKELPWR